MLIASEKLSGSHSIANSVILGRVVEWIGIVSSLKNTKTYE